jgi:peptide/nickel transport system substrate-binding protein
MNETSDYWSRHRFSRRRFLGGAAALGTGLALAACGGGEKPAGETPAAATPTSEGLEPARTSGGTLRSFGWDALALDTLDPHQTQIGTTYNLHSVVFSKVLKYDNVYEGIITPDLAESMPEVVDELTYIVKLRPDVTFHDTEAIRAAFPQVAGRQLTAEDVKYSIERQMNPNSPKSALYYRASQWETVDRIEVTDPLTLRITTKRPTAPLIHYLGDNNAFIVPKEVVDETDEMNDASRMVGSGPFMLKDFISVQVVKGVRNPAWFARNDRADQGLPDRPILDGYETIWYPEDDTAIEVAFRSKQVDTTGFTDRANSPRIASETGAVVDEYMDAGWLASRFLVADSPAATTPFKDFRLRKAINIAIDRNRMGQQMFRKWFYLVGPVPGAIKRWALPQAELVQKPGYRFDTQERQEDLAEAKKLWEAAGGPGIGKFTITYAGIPGYLADFFPQFQGMLREVLDAESDGDLDITGYTKLAQGSLEKRIILSLNYDNGWNDLDDWVYPYFHTDGPKNSFNLSDPELDRMLEAQREEFDYEARRDIGFQIQNYLLDSVLARLDWMAEINAALRWPYVRNRSKDPWFGNAFHLADTWLDSEDPLYQGRA